MADFHLYGQRLDNSLVTSISHLLDSVGVPNLLWGNYLLTVYGIPTFVDVNMLLAKPYYGTRLISFFFQIGRCLCGAG